MLAHTAIIRSRNTACTNQWRQRVCSHATSISLPESKAWAKRILPLKNAMLAQHARDIETALEAKLLRIDNGLAASVPTAQPSGIPTGTDQSSRNHMTMRKL